jgi:site-specific DNA-methyltransferase (adenine-specific)
MLNNNNLALHYNPDVLTCLANLSNDEVFTPPNMVARMLDLLPAEIWSDREARFLDPVCKSGVFLREIAARLNTGLESQIPDKQTRINHIFKQQLFGLAITDLTALLSRRSVYCSKTANGPYSVCDEFSDEQGNIRFERVQHSWHNGRCQFCGASEGEYSRDETLETHAYQFIHTKQPEELFNMKFDVIVGNPPYQLNDGGGTGSSAKPIYQLFVQQAKKLNPRYLTMIIPSRWFAGGKGLDEFREEMLNDSRMRRLVDYTDSRDCFPGVDIAGGICYFLWDRDTKGDCTVENIHSGMTTVSERQLNEFDTFVRDSVAIDVIRKVTRKSNTFLDTVVSSRKPFGLESKIRPTKSGDLTLISSGGEGPFPSSKVLAGNDMIQKWKVLLSKASHDHGGQADKEGKRRVFSKVETLPPGTICTESYLIVGTYKTQSEADNMVAYLKTKFCRFLVSTVLLTQNIAKDRFQFVPALDMNEEWTDEKLYKKYGLTEDEIAFIESKIRPMELAEK